MGFTRRGAAAAAALTLLATLGACKSSTTTSSAPPAGAAPTSAAAVSSPTASATAVDSCTVVTLAQVESATGQTMSTPIRGKATVEGGVACVFYGPQAPATRDADVPAPDTVRVVLVTGSDAAKYFTDYRGKVKAQSVPGLGDQAFYDGGSSLSVLAGSNYLRIAVIVSASVPTNDAAEQKLAMDALPSL